MSIKKLFVLIVILNLFQSCGLSPSDQYSEGIEKEEPQQKQSTVTAAKDDSNINADREPLDEEFNEYGLVKLVEDLGYPFYNLLIEFPERQMEASFMVNKEDLSYSGATLEELTGEYISFYYVNETENNLSDILYNGKSVLGEYGYHDNDMKVVVGTLTNAEAETQGDIPGNILITTANGDKYSIDCFISSEIVAVNNKEVKVYFSEEFVNKITYIRLSEF
jgi:hypothetical protein